jgi:membrane protease YdiL (CAAX protease family)
MTEHEPNTPRWMPPLDWGGTLITFGAAGVLLALITRVAIPAAVARTGIEPVAWWFVLGGLGVFLPLAVASVLLLRQEALDGTDIWRDRLRFRALSRDDWRAVVLALLTIGALRAVIQFGFIRAGFASALQPEFLAIEPIGPGRRWILAVWVPFFVLNILSEELLWRGVILPRQEAALGRRAWIANALGWGVFHFAFGVALLAVLVPILLILPWTAQRRRNSWVGVAIHAGLNGPGFLAVALGAI